MAENLGNAPIFNDYRTFIPNMRIIVPSCYFPLFKGKSNVKFSDRLNKHMEQQNLSNYWLSRQVGVSEKAVRNWRTGKSEPRGKHLMKLAAVLKKSPLWFESGKEEIKVTAPVPVLGRVPAGFPDTIAEEIIEYISLPDAPKNSYALKVKGDSMLPTIREGDYVIFINDGDIKHGDVVVVNNEFGDSMIKRYRKKGAEVFFVSDNPEYKPFQPNEHYRIIGKVVDIWSRRKP